MGYWSDYKPKGMSMNEFFEKKYNYEDENIKLNVLDSAFTNYCEGYIAIERIIKKENIKYVFCLVVLVRWENTLGGDNCMIKEMDEFVMPYYYNCPERILKLLTDFDKFKSENFTDKEKENSREWRNHCKKRIEKRKMLAKGNTIKLKNAILIGGMYEDTFTVIDRRKKLYKCKNIGFMAKMKDMFILNKDFELVTI